MNIESFITFTFTCIIWYISKYDIDVTGDTM